MSFLRRLIDKQHKHEMQSIINLALSLHFATHENDATKTKHLYKFLKRVDGTIEDYLWEQIPGTVVFRPSVEPGGLNVRARNGNLIFEYRVFYKDQLDAVIVYLAFNIDPFKNKISAKISIEDLEIK